MSLTSLKIKSLTRKNEFSVTHRKYGASGENRTLTPKRERDFESCHYSMISKPTLDFLSNKPPLYPTGFRLSLTRLGGQLCA